MRAARWLVIPVLAIPLAWVLFSSLGRDPSEIPSPLVGQPMPAFALTALDGSTVTSEDLAGQPAVINFWAHWCIPACVEEHPVLMDAQTRHGDEVQLVGILYDDNPADAREFLVRYGDGGWPNADDPSGAVALAYGVLGPPETFFVDADWHRPGQALRPPDGGGHGRQPGPDRGHAMTTARAGRWIGLVLVAAAIIVGALLVLRPAAPPSAAEQARAIAAELRCPDCAGLSAADSPTQAAAEIRREVAAQLAAGQTPDEIRASFVARYGSWILLTPPGPAPWLIPLLATGIGAVVLALWLLRPAAPERREGGNDRGTVGCGRLRTEAPSPTARRAAVGVALALVVLVAIGLALPEPYSLAAETVVNQPLAEAQAAEARRQAEIERLLAAVAADPADGEALSDLADAYLAGSTAEDLQKAAITLLALIGQDADDPEPYGRLITAYIRAGDWTDAAAATDALAELAPNSPDVPFFRGLIAWQGKAMRTPRSKPSTRSSPRPLTTRGCR